MTQQSKAHPPGLFEWKSSGGVSSLISLQWCQLLMAISQRRIIWVFSGCVRTRKWLRRVLFTPAVVMVYPGMPQDLWASCFGAAGATGAAQWGRDGGQDLCIFATTTT